ncbi:YbaK/EbsC family protein [Tenggerimyces flavus]|uniref:YbaK/EbsC family protein n=1 Tax=Tenggerimyces flavus TaxID=1708749 RepID=A0ABV7Y3Z7_9ACTN|nr:YbaK/EbsC family protein [Tenggerimyces flavus]MBM7788452.1 prolyl-tRNA editing enzyme YbaK/EbsC (Cys-tRNA(Pro) deacylase) [Tenggerimyces flavus]
MTTSIGTLQAVPALDRPDLLAPPVLAALNAWPSGKVGVDEVLVAEIDPDLADTAAFCERYEVGLEVSANCVVVAGRRGENTTLAACVILATTRADVNGFVRKRLDARKASFAPMDTAVELTGMEYGGITPIGLPADWPLLVDQRVLGADAVIIGSGVRRSKILLPGRALADLPGAEVTAELGILV